MTATSTTPARTTRTATSSRPAANGGNYMAKDYANQHDFARWQERAASMTDAELIFAIKDASHASRKADHFDPVTAGYYADEASTYSMELNRRRAASGRRSNPPRKKTLTVAQWAEGTAKAIAAELRTSDLPPSYRQIFSRQYEAIGLLTVYNHDQATAISLVNALAGHAVHGDREEANLALTAIDLLTRNYIEPLLQGKPPIMDSY